MDRSCGAGYPRVLYDFDVPARISAWRPRLDGVVEVLHAHLDGHAYPMHAHDTWTLLIIDDGAVRYDLDRHERGAFGDLVTLLPPHVPHNGASATPGGFHKRVFYLAPDRLPDALIGAAVDNPTVGDPSLRGRVAALHRVIRQPGEEFEAQVRLADVIERLRAWHGRPALPGRLDRAPAYRLRDLLEEHVVPGLSLDEAARALHFHPAYLVRSFTREFGMSPHRYLVSRRVDLARRLIVAGEPLGSAAVDSGFYDQPHLVRHFRRILGVSPRAFAPASGAAARQQDGAGTGHEQDQAGEGQRRDG
ncbi:AraC family transcriptional regulator [Amorphoplanes digitatis]|uniref:helix-turn-helix transcriptional regulator n=1 Tax=Actinoplanes digitatis TaxID=1868 RepID=UPI00160AE6C8